MKHIGFRIALGLTLAVAASMYGGAAWYVWNQFTIGGRK